MPESNREYRITWTIDLTGSSAVDACEQALAIMRDRESIGTVFEALPLEPDAVLGDGAIRVDLADVAKPEFAYATHPDGPAPRLREWPWTYYDEDGSAWWMSHHCAACARSAGEPFRMAEAGYRSAAERGELS